jgi:hypothetical protein
MDKVIYILYKSFNISCIVLYKKFDSATWEKMKQSGLNIQVSASVSFMKVHGGASSMTDEQKQVNSFSHSLTFSLSLSFFLSLTYYHSFSSLFLSLSISHFLSFFLSLSHLLILILSPLSFFPFYL